MKKLSVALILAFGLSHAVFAANDAVQPKVPLKAYALGQMVAMCQMKAGTVDPASEGPQCKYARAMWGADCMKSSSCMTYQSWVGLRPRLL